MLTDLQRSVLIAAYEMMDEDVKPRGQPIGKEVMNHMDLDVRHTEFYQAVRELEDADFVERPFL